MAQFSRTWWGKRFIAILESFTAQSRLERGRSYASNGKIRKFRIKDGRIYAAVKGSINHYYGVYEEPQYSVEIEIQAISKADWALAIASISSKASFVSKLLMNEMPDNIEEAFFELNLHLLPRSYNDFSSSCSCPDYANPCKHVAGVYYSVASQLDSDPFLLFELRGLSRDELQKELAKSPLGKALSSALASENIPVEPRESYYTTPKKAPVSNSVSLKEFWMGEKRLPQTIEVPPPASVPAILVKKAGDYPPFWNKDNSLIAAMEEVYRLVKTKNKQVM